MFWPLISEPFIKYVNEVFETKELSSSQKQAVITLIEKKPAKIEPYDLEMLSQNAWRPFVNTVYFSIKCRYKDNVESHSF